MGDFKPGRILAGAGILAFGAVGVWIAYSRFAIDHNVPLPNAVDAERLTFTSAEVGELSYYADTTGQGRPIVLIHSINAASSAYEMKPLFDHYAGERPVYALDLPGYGFSNRADRVYSPGLYTTAIIDFLRSEVGESVDVVTFSLGSEFSAEAARREPDLVNSLALIAPTGFSEGGGIPDSDVLYGAFTFPVWSQAFYDALTSKPSLNLFLDQIFVEDAPPGFIEYAYKTTHQPGAKNAPFYFVSGKLFSPQIYETTYTQLELPVLVFYGRDPNVSFERIPMIIDEYDNWDGVRLDSTIPHWEKLPEVTEALDAFWE